MPHRYPIADAWYRRLDMDHGVVRLWEPHVHPLEQANFWHVRGRDRDLLIDSGMGIVPLRESFPDLFGDREVIAFATHTHIDHIGAIHEFEHRWVHPAEAQKLASPSGIVTLRCADIPAALCDIFVRAGYPPFDEWLIDAFPHADYDPARYRLRGGAPTRLVTERDVIDLGDRRFELSAFPGTLRRESLRLGTGYRNPLHRRSRVRRTAGLRRAGNGARNLRAILASVEGNCPSTSSMPVMIRASTLNAWSISSIITWRAGE
jgi:hypothetical protein